MAAPLLSVCLFALLASLKLRNRRHCPFVALILLVSLPFLNAVALSRSDFSFLFLMTMSLTTCPVSVIGHLSTLPLHAHYAIHLPFAFHALAHPCFCPLLSTSLLLPTTLLWKASELNFCLSLLPPSILLIYSSSSSLKLILNISIFPFWFLLLDEKEYNNNNNSWYSKSQGLGEITVKRRSENQQGIKWRLTAYGKWMTYTLSMHEGRQKDLNVKDKCLCLFSKTFLHRHRSNYRQS